LPGAVGRTWCVLPVFPLLKDVQMLERQESWAGELVADLPLQIPQERLSAALSEADSSGRPVTRVMVELGLVEEAALLGALAERLGLSFTELEPGEVDERAVSEVPAKVAEHYGIMPVALSDQCVEVAVDDPFNWEALDELRVVLGRRVEPVLACRDAIERAMRRHYGVGAETIESLMAEDSGMVVVESSDARQADLAEESEAERASVIRLVNQLLLDAIRERATDVHLEPYEEELRVRYRVDGVLREARVPPAARHFRSAIVSRIKIMANLDIAEKRLPQDGRAQVKLGSEEFDLRISILPVPQGEAVNIRILPRRPVFSELPSLGLEGRDAETVEGLLSRPHGIVLVTGPTGSGKTTTLYACLTKLNRPTTKILTIEDPIEYRIRGIQQMQVAPAIGFTFARALRSMLRHDPDIMLVGEVRDAETARITIRTALTGHLVFSTLHTNDAAGAATRLVDMGVEPYLISSSVIGVLAQRLVRRLCPKCRTECDLGPAAVRHFGLEPEGREGIQAYRGRGCEYCRLTGYRGRTAIFEILPVAGEIRDMIAASRPASEIRAHARKRGMRSLREAGWQKVKAGVTSAEEVLRVTQRDDDAGGRD